MERTSRGGPGAPIVGGLVAMALVLAGCGGDEPAAMDGADGVEAAQERVAAAEGAVAESQTALDEATEVFCESSEAYVTAVDRYGKAFSETAATVGDITTAGADLAEPRDAGESLQSDSDLPVTGLVDRATAAALDGAVAANDDQAATEAVAHTAAVQSTLRLAGHWTGPVDGRWTPELTTALEAFQTDLGVDPTGAVDAATLQALELEIAEAQSPPTTTTLAATTTSPT